MRVHFAGLVALAAVLLALGARAQAPAPPPAQPPADPEVKALLAQVAKAYKDLTAFSATIETTQGTGDKADKTVTKLVLQKPNKLSATVSHGTDLAHVVADAKNLYADSSSEKTTYLKASVGTFADIVQQLMRSRGGGIGLLPILLMGEGAEQQIIPGPATKQAKGADETIDGVACDTLTAELGTVDNGAKFSFAFGKQDHLLRRLSIAPLKAGPVPEITEIHTSVTTTPTVTDGTFAYTPPAGAKPIDKPAEPRMFDARIKKGASPLPFSGKDLAGKPVALAAYKGKVLLIDFWATWCGPCVGELPNVIKAYSKYHSQGFEIVGVSLDREGDKAKLQKFIADKKMPWRQIYDGKYWEAANAKAWGVQSIPFTVLLGKDGKIAAVGARGDQLEPAIKAALAAK